MKSIFSNEFDLGARRQFGGQLTPCPFLATSLLHVTRLHYVNRRIQDDKTSRTVFIGDKLVT